MNMMTEIPPFEIRNAFRDPRAVHFQEEIRRAMMKARAPGQMACALPPPAAVAPPMNHAQNCRTVLMHLVDGEDGRTGLTAILPLQHRTMDRVLAELHDKGFITRGKRDRSAVYHITPAGVDAIDAPLEPEKRPEPMPTGPRKKKGPSTANVDAVFRMISAQPATRVAMQRALGVGASTMEDCLRVLRLQDRIMWVRDPKTNIKTYMVRA